MYINSGHVHHRLRLGALIPAVTEGPLRAVVVSATARPVAGDLLPLPAPVGIIRLAKMIVVNATMIAVTVTETAIAIVPGAQMIETAK